MPLPLVMRSVGLLVLLAAILELVLLDDLQIPPFIIGAGLVAASFAAVRWPRPLAWLAIVLGILIPVGAVIRYLDGLVIWVVPVFDAVVFGWLFWTALRLLRTRAPQPASS